MDFQSDELSVEELTFQKTLGECNLSALPLHECFDQISLLLDQFIQLRDKLINQSDKKYNLLIHLQLLKAKLNFLLEKCFADDDNLAQFFYLHERISFIHGQIENHNSEHPAPIEIPVLEDSKDSEDPEELEFENQNGLFECPICYDEVSYVNTQSLQTCSHRYCNECLNLYFNNIINDGMVCEMVCPNPECGEYVLDSDIRKAVDNPTMEKYERFSLLNYLNSNPDAFWCAYEDCGNVMLADPSEERVRCNKCFRSSCVQCKTKWHPHMSCSENKASLAPEDEKTQKWKRKHGVKACPHCGQLTIRVSGCPDMICSSCKNHWSWSSVGEKKNETWIETLGYYYPRTMKRVVGSRDVLEDWEKDKKATAKDLAPFMILSTIIGIPVCCLTLPPAYITKRVRSRKSNTRL